MRALSVAVIGSLALAVGCGSNAPAPTTAANDSDATQTIADDNAPDDNTTSDKPAEPLEQAPTFSLPAHDGSTVALADLLNKGPAVLVFYRGHW